MWLSKFRHRKLQSALIFVMITACTLLMAGSLEIFVALIKPFEQFVKDTNAPVVRATMFHDQGENQQEIVKKFKAINGVEYVNILERHIVSEKVKTKDKVVDETVTLVNYNQNEFEKLRMITGNNKQPKDSECMIPYSLANINDISVGDMITVEADKNEYSYRVVSIYSAPYSCNIMYQSEILINQLPKTLDSSYTYAIHAKKNVTGQDIVDHYVENNNKVMDGRFDTIEDVVGNITLNEKILGGILLALSLIVFLVCIIMIRFLIRNALLNDKKTIAIYKTIGYQEKDILLLYIKFYMSITFIGTLVGASLSPVLSTSFLKGAFKNIGLNKVTVHLWPRIGIMSFVLLLVVIQVYYSVIKLKKVKPVIVLNDRESTLGVKKKEYRSLPINISFSPFGMAFRLIQRNKKSAFYITLICFLTTYTVNFALTSYSNVRLMSENNYYWLGFDKHDVTLITTNVKQFDKTCQEITNLPEVDKVVKNSFDLRASLKWKKGMSNPNVEGMVYDTYEGLELPLIDGRNPKYNNEVVLNTLLTDELNKKIGDYIDIYFTADKKVSMLIVGTFQSYMNMGRSIRILGGALIDAGLPCTYTDASVILKEDTSVEQFLDKYSNTYAKTVKMIDRRDKYSNMLHEISDPQKAAIGPFIAVVLLISCMNLFCIIYIQNVSNKKKYAIYKSIGYSYIHLVKMNLYYVGVINILSIIVAIPIFIVAFPKIMTITMSIFGFKQYPVFYEPPLMVIGNIAVFIILIVTVLFTSHSLRGSQLEELANE